MKYKIVEIIKNGEKGILLIEEKKHQTHYSLNLILLESNNLVALQSEDFKIIGEIDIDD